MCTFMCDAGRTYNTVDELCDVCTVASDCAVGHEITGECSHSEDRVCVVCAVLADANEEYTVMGGCDTGCSDGFFADSATGVCVVCTTGCGDGMYPSGVCSTASDYTCAVCGGRGVTEYFTGSGTVRDAGSCSKETCVSSCGVGSFLDGECAATEGPACTVCAAALPVDATYDSEGITCDFTCSDGYFVSSGVCEACAISADCDVGTVLIGECTHNSNPTCIECQGGAPENAHFVSGLDENGDCLFECDVAYSWNGMECFTCLTAADCGAGREVTGVCSHTNATLCSMCDELQEGEAFVANGTCVVECISGYYRVDGACMNCTTSCSNGQYAAGTCGGESDHTCEACTGRVAGQYYSTSGDVGVPGSCSVTQCDLDCTEDGFFLSGECTETTGSECLICPNLESCGVGVYLVGSCADGTAECVDCTTGLMGAVYTTTGGTTDSCESECDRSSYTTGTQCLPCTVCTSSQFALVDCSDTKDRVCADCRKCDLDEVVDVECSLTADRTCKGGVDVDDSNSQSTNALQGVSDIADGYIVYGIAGCVFAILLIVFVSRRKPKKKKKEKRRRGVESANLYESDSDEELELDMAATGYYGGN